MNRLYKRAAAAALGILLVCTGVSAAGYTPYPMADIWNTSFEFSQSSLLDGKVNTANYKSNWISTFTNIMLNAGTAASIRDSYTDTESGERIYDSVSGEAGDYYLYVHQVKDSASSTAAISYFNSSNLSGKTQSHSNGGAIYGNAVYEFDMRLTPGEWSGAFSNTNNKAGYASVWGWNNTSDSIVEIARMSYDSYDTTDKTWYPTYYSSETNAQKGFGVIRETNAWYKMRICIDVKRQKAKYYVLNTDGVIIRESGEQNFKSKCDYALTNLDIRAGSYRDFCLDNVSISKDSFAVGDVRITEEDGKICASVPVSNDVYAAEGHGDEAPCVSPAAFLAVYDKENKLIGFDMKTVEFKGHTVENTMAGADRAKMFSMPQEFVNIQLEADKPKTEYTAKVYVWSAYNNARPYLLNE